MGLLEATANDYDRIQHSNKVVEFSWWLVAVALTARPKPTRKQGLRQSGHWKVFAHFRAWVKLGEEHLSSEDSQGAEQRRPMGVLTNVAALDQFLYFGWPEIQMQQGRLAYQGPLPRSCACGFQHQPVTSFYGNRFQFWRCASSYASVLAAYFPSALAGLWSRSVMDVERLSEGINDPGRAAISAVVQVEDGDTWLELRSLVASAESDGKPRPRVTAVVRWSGSDEEAANIRKTTGGELKKVLGLCRYREDDVQASLGHRDAKDTRTTAEGGKVSDGGAEDLPNDSGKTESRTRDSSASKDGQPSCRDPQRWRKEWCLRNLSFEIMKCVHDFWGWADRTYVGGGKPIMTGLMM